MSKFGMGARNGGIGKKDEDQKRRGAEGTKKGMRREKGCEAL